MNEPINLAPDVFWVGALNPKLRVFDIIMQTEQGTTYNAYLVRGRDKTALIETVKGGQGAELFARIEKIIPLDQIDYLILNHLEPDHSGSVLDCLKQMPRARVVVSHNGKSFLKELTNQELEPLTVGTGDRLDLGGKTLEFITAPFLHWPDTMMTYLPEEQILFSCDFFGRHACSPTGNIFEDPREDFSHALDYYFSVIFRPFKEYVLKGLEAIADKPIRCIAPSHGPVLRESVGQVQALYRQWSQPVETVPGGRLAVVYASAYGLTGRLAEAVAQGARDAGTVTALFDLTGIPTAELLTVVEASDGVAVGSTTINGDAVEPVWALLSSLATVKVKGKWAAAFGSYGWSGEAVPMIEERLTGIKMKLAAPGLRVRFTPTDADLEGARLLGRTLAEKIQAKPA